MRGEGQELELFVLNQPDAKAIPNGHYSDFMPAAFTLAHRALAAAEILARPAALIVDFFFTTGLAAGLATGVLALAQRAFCAAAILARAEALIFNFFF